MWPTKSKIFTICPFQKKAANLWVKPFGIFLLEEIEWRSTNFVEKNPS